MPQKSFSEQLKDKLVKIEVSNDVSFQKKFTQNDFKDAARSVKETFKDENLQDPKSLR